jgi:PPOX class probable F420-dependent enzyme
MRAECANGVENNGGGRMPFTVAKFLDVAEGPQPGQFTIGDHEEAVSLDDLDPIYLQLLDEPVTATIAVMGKDGRPNLTPIWVDRRGDTLLLNFSEQRKKVGWLRANPEFTLLLMNPENTYHWLSIKGTVIREIHEDDPEEGARVKAATDDLWRQYTGNDGEYGLRDESVGERRVLFEAKVDRIATFGRP